MKHGDWPCQSLALEVINLTTSRVPGGEHWYIRMTKPSERTNNKYRYTYVHLYVYTQNVVSLSHYCKALAPLEPLWAFQRRFWMWSFRKVPPNGPGLPQSQSPSSPPSTKWGRKRVTVDTSLFIDGARLWGGRPWQDFPRNSKKTAENQEHSRNPEKSEGIPRQQIITVNRFPKRSSDVLRNL